MTKASIRKTVGLDYDQMQKMSAEEIDAFIEKRLGKKLKYAFSVKGLINRGSVLLYKRRMVSMKSVDERLAKI